MYLPALRLIIIISLEVFVARPSPFADALTRLTDIPIAMLIDEFPCPIEIFTGFMWTSAVFTMEVDQSVSTPNFFAVARSARAKSPRSCDNDQLVLHVRPRSAYDSP